MEDLEIIVYVHPPLLENDFSQYEHYTYISEETITYGKDNDREILILERATKDGNPSVLVPGFIINYKTCQNPDGQYISMVTPVQTVERLEVAEFLRGMKTLKIGKADIYFINNEIEIKKVSGRGGSSSAAA